MTTTIACEKCGVQIPDDWPPYCERCLTMCDCGKPYMECPSYLEYTRDEELWGDVR